MVSQSLLPVQLNKTKTQKEIGLYSAKFKVYHELNTLILWSKSIGKRLETRPIEKPLQD